jgi:hypothetical protein
MGNFIKKIKHLLNHSTIHNENYERLEHISIVEPHIVKSHDITSVALNENIISVCSLIELYPDKPWNISYLSSSTYITIDFVIKHIELKWDMSRLSKNPSIKISDMLKHKNLKWDMIYVAKNPSLTAQDILDNPDLNWNWEYLSDNPII